MNIIPALDLINGRVVRLSQGDFDRQTTYKKDAVRQALAYEAAGAKCLHVVDLESARDGGETNLPLIGELCQALQIPVQVGGGVRSLRDIQTRLDLGASRVVVGSVCVQEPERFLRWLEAFGPEVMVAGLDVRAKHLTDRTVYVPQTSGWTKSGVTDLFELLETLMPAGLKHLLCTDVELDGMLQGGATTLYRLLTERCPSLEIQASGGVGSRADLELIRDTGVSACIVGRALLEGQIELAEIGRFNASGEAN